MSQAWNSYGRVPTAAQAHRQRCARLTPLRAGEVERLTADFLATRSITACPTRYVVPVAQHAGPVEQRSYITKKVVKKLEGGYV
jgi:hypothetical protein